MGLISMVKDYLRAQERDKQFLLLDQCVKNGDVSAAQNVVHTLISRGIMEDALMPAVVRSALFGLEGKNPEGAKSIALTIMSGDINKKVKIAAAERAAEMIKNIDTSDKKDLPQLATLSLAIADAAEKGSTLETDALAQWEKTINTIAADNLQQGLLTVCDAILHPEHKGTVSKRGIEKWKSLVETLAAINSLDARQEAVRVIQKCQEFGKQAIPLRIEAFALAKRYRINGAAAAAPKAA